MQNHYSVNIEVAMDRGTLGETPNANKVCVTLEARQKCTVVESKLALQLHQYKMTAVWLRDGGED